MMKQIFIAAALVLGMNAHAATEDLDELLSKIEADINAQRLAEPAGNNALEGIDTFRSQAPFDFRITPLIFKFGESYVALANKAMAKKKYSQAQDYLDIAWRVSALAPGLGAAQEKNDKLSDGRARSKKLASQGPSASELKAQKALAAAAIAEKKRIDKERKNKLKANKQAIADKAEKAAANKKAKQDAERKRRLADAKLQELKQQQAQATKDKNQKNNLQKQLAAAEAQAEQARLQSLAQNKAAPIRLAQETPIGNGVETSPPIASYPLSQDKISDRDRGISQDLVDICKAIINEDASIVLHADNKGDYRWLTVRLTLCTRRLDPSFRLRHSFDNKTTNKPFIALHPSRSRALLGDM
ncbi:MAG: colicin import membrane protein [Oleispira sp.]|jgi:colicin import membrane protein